MINYKYRENFQKALDLIHNRKSDEAVVALIIDSPWFLTHITAQPLDFFFDKKTWLDSYITVYNQLEGAVFIPGMWVEYGMAAEPSGWGAKIKWNSNQPPSIAEGAGGLEIFADAQVPDPETDGLMPLILRHYQSVQERLSSNGLGPYIVASRGPLAIASHLLGVTSFLTNMMLDPAQTHKLLRKTTDLTIKWLKTQLERISEPQGILVLDDIVGFLSPETAAIFAAPYLKDIFDSFPGLIHFYHNDTPNKNVFPCLSKIGIDVFNFSCHTPIKEARELLGPDMVLMGNIDPLNILARGTEDMVRNAARDMLSQVKDYGPILISAGGGVSPGTPLKNLQVLIGTVTSRTNNILPAAHL